MNPKHLTAAAVIAAGVVLSAVTSGLGLVNAAALDPPPSAPTFRPGSGWAAAGHSSRKMLEVRAQRRGKPPRRRRDAADTYRSAPLRQTAADLTGRVFFRRAARWSGIFSASS